VPLRPDQDIAFSEELEPEPVFSTEVQEGIREIAKHDSSFHIGHFSEGARLAFEMIIKAYAEADKEKLKELLSDSVLQKFSKLIDQRAIYQRRNHSLHE
jgi:predicted lipid-binding transport protein (Tim44 family)